MHLHLTKMQVSAVAAMLRDEMEEDERLYLDALEGETDLYELTRHLLCQIEQDEGIQAILAKQIEDRLHRKNRAAERVKHNREGIVALLQCANLDKLVLPEATLSILRVAPKPIITDEAAIPDEFCRFTRKPDIAAIKAGVEAGAAVPGVSFGNGSLGLTVRRK